MESLGFSEFGHGVRNPYQVVRDRARFFRKTFFCPKNWEDVPKIGFFEFKEKFGHWFSLNLFYNERVMTQVVFLWGKGIIKI